MTTPITVDLCQSYPRVVSRSGLSLNVLAHMDGGCR